MVQREDNLSILGDKVASIRISEERGVRSLHLGSELIQGAMRIARPWALELEYTRELMLPLALRSERGWPRSVLQIGLGPGSVTKFLYRHRPKATITVVELVPEVVTAARHFFKLPDDPARLHIELGEGHDYLAGQSRRFDLIVVDGFDEKGRCGMLDTVAFYLACRARLASGGMMATNLLTRHRGAAPSVERMRKAFDDGVLLLPPSEAGNAIAIAGNAPIVESIAELRAAVLSLKAETGLDLRASVARLEEARARERL